MTKKMTGDKKAESSRLREDAWSLTLSPARRSSPWLLWGRAEGTAPWAVAGLLGGPARCRWLEWLPSTSPRLAEIRVTSGPRSPACIRN